MRILIVSWAWPPIGRIGALRPLGFAREWRKAGHEVHVLTGPGDRGGEYSPDLIASAEETRAIVHRADAPAVPRPIVVRAAYQGPANAQVARSVVRWRQIVAQWRTFPDSQRSWIPEGLRKGLAVQATYPVDVVFSTSPPESVHYVAKALAAAGVPWVADFRDPWSDYLFARWDPVSRWLIEKIARRVLSQAAAVTTNAEGVAASIQRVTPRSVRCIRNGYDHVAIAGRQPTKRTLGYFGRIDPLLQRPDHLWPALRRLRQMGEPWRVEFHLTPGGGGGAGASIPPDLIDVVSVNPPLPHAEALTRMQEMTANLVLCIDGRGGEGIVPGKLYDYVGATRPILVCAPNGFEARALVERTGTGRGAWGTEELTEVLTTLESFQPDPRGRSDLSREHVAAEMLELFREVCQGAYRRR